MPAWNDLAARVRGFESRRLGAATLTALARTPDARTFARTLRATAYGALPFDDAPTAADIDLLARRMAAHQLRILARWADARVTYLTVIFEDEDRRSLTALLRGALGGVAPELRLSGVIPTPALPERALAELARQPTAGAIAALLAAWQNPYAPALLEAAAPVHPDPAALEMALHRTFAARALRNAGHVRALVAYVQETIDLENLAAVLVGAGSGSVQPLLPGGCHLEGDVFAAAVEADGADAALDVLRVALRRTPLSGLMRRLRTADVFEAAALAWHVRTWRRRAREAPLGAAPILAWLVRLRAEVFDLRTLAWSRALGVVPDPEDLVSP